MVQTCRVLRSRRQWKRKAIKRGTENRELRKALNRKNEQIARLKSKVAAEAVNQDSTESEQTDTVKKSQ